MATTKAAPGKKGLINFDFLQKLGMARMMMNWPAFAFLAISGASMTISVTVGFNSRFLTILNTCSNLAFSPFYHSVPRLPNAHKQAKG